MITEQQFKSIELGQKVAIVSNPDQKPEPGKCESVAEIWARCESKEDRWFLARRPSGEPLAIHAFSEVGTGYYLLQEKAKEQTEAKAACLELGMYTSQKGKPFLALFFKDQVDRELFGKIYDEAKANGGWYVHAAKAILFRSLEEARQLAQFAQGLGLDVVQTLVEEESEEKLDQMPAPKRAPEPAKETSFRVLTREEIRARFPFGSRYSKEIDAKEAAAKIRADLKAAKKEGLLPKELKVSVRSEFYSMGSSVNIQVTACPFPVLNPYQLKFDQENPALWVANLPEKHPAQKRFTPEAQAVKDLLQAFHSLYNFDESDSQTDYFHKNYFGDAEFATDLTMAERKQILAELEQGGYSRYQFEGLNWSEIDA